MISLSSCESELRSMMSGCCDALFIRRCMEFLIGSPIEHWQFTDNSAARQLSSRQGVGRVRHLSGKLLWIQDLVLRKELTVSQVPTQWNYSDIGTKALKQARVELLMHGVGAIDPETLEVIG